LAASEIDPPDLRELLSEAEACELLDSPRWSRGRLHNPLHRRDL